ncbi:MAG: Cell wall alpha-1,3-glucan synthase ags1 [Geoglossum simile]|nr:MAG: Cell wall alpha-1,3-glucan synthase ags1 [Geoglossum simile]
MQNLLGLLAVAFSATQALIFDPDEIKFNLNQNETAFDALDYSGTWDNHTYEPSPDNWRFPIYSTFLDRFVNGDPVNDNANGTLFEQDLMSNQLRHGGDIKGLRDSLDYLQGTGAKGIYIIGSPFVNQPWGADSYSPLDLSLLDRHFGSIQDWRDTIDDIHSRGMYIILDNTFSTLGDLLGFDGFLNASAPFKQSEYKVQYKTSRAYNDFRPGSEYLPRCSYPRFWGIDGLPLGKKITDTFKGCYDSEFDQYGHDDASDKFPDYQRQLTKFAGVQDRLREWRPDVRQKISRFSCLTIAMLDIDGYRMDKAAQVTVDAFADWSESIRECARELGKNNFLIIGEVTGPNSQAAVYLGRGRQPNMAPPTIEEALALTNISDSKFFIRQDGKSAIDAAAFHYSTYRSLLRFLGMDGKIANGPDAPLNWVDQWNTMLRTNDLTNANTGQFDPRHMFGVTNQDVFRWPAIRGGTERQLLGTFITTLHMPGIPALYFGEEQSLYLLDNTASNYLFGRQPMSASLAWQNHGCYKIGSFQFPEMGLEKALSGCTDDEISLDHRDPSNPVRNIIKAMYQMRENYPVLNDGYFLQQLSNQTRLVQLPFSQDVPTEIGLWSTVRGSYAPLQNFSNGQGDQAVWLVYQNDNLTVNYKFNCSAPGQALLSPFSQNTTVKNLFPPFEEYVLEESTEALDGASSLLKGCLAELEMPAWGYKAYVPKEKWIGPGPMITKFVPGHDARIKSRVASGELDTIPFELQFSSEMDCEKLTNSVTVESTSEYQSAAKLDVESATCQNITNPDPMAVPGAPPSTFSFKANLVEVPHGIHVITVKNATLSNDSGSTRSTDRFYLRVGRSDNAVVFPRNANYSRSLLNRGSNGNLFISHAASGADKFRYSLNWGTTYSDWEDYKGGNTTLAKKVWSGTKRQQWKGEHVIVQYWSRTTGSSSHVQHGDVNSATPRRFPHLFAHGPFNDFGFDIGLPDQFELSKDGLWKFNFMAEWPTNFQINVWGMNPDGKPDMTGIFGDVDFDSVLDRLPPNTLSPAVINTTLVPPSPHLAYRIELNDGTYTYKLVPAGSRAVQVALYSLLWLIPVISGALAVFAFMGAFYRIKFNKVGASGDKALIPLVLRRKWKRLRSDSEDSSRFSLSRPATPPVKMMGGTGTSRRRTVLIATMEYDIEDWEIKVKIGGLGVMAQLMGKNLGHQDLIWVVPCVGGIDYPEAHRVESMFVTVLGQKYEVEIQYHVLRNITYILLDAPVFRQQTKSEPYPPRMDDLDSAIYYSSWNQCVAQAIKRFPVDIYHINDYHGAAAPLYLLPNTIPCCLSMHNAEFQGLWPMRNSKEKDEVCSVFNLDMEVVQKYVQFGDVFNLLHAGASYLRIHQKGFGGVGVSNKYGERSWARYPIFWGLPKIGKLPNPDPTDTGEWTGEMSKEAIVVDPAFETSRGELRRQAQEWAGLDQNPNAELFVFVGRWSMQKGVDLIADIFPAILEEHSNVQLICIGPVIDLYGKFAALKLGVMMEKYPGRVFSKPEFTALPPYIFSGAEFALIPSRDEPFGLVAVEFGRKGALGVGALVGGLGQMPGWWFTVESTATSHLIHQFKKSVKEALASDLKTRAMMRARSAKQRFPVAQWVADLEKLQSTSIDTHQKEAKRAPPQQLLDPKTVSPSFVPPRARRGTGASSRAGSPSPYPIASRSRRGTDASSRGASPPPGLSLQRARRDTGESSRAASPSPAFRGSSHNITVGTAGDYTPQRTLSLGIRAGPGHAPGRARPVAGDNRISGIEEVDDILNEHLEEYLVSPDVIPSHQAGEHHDAGQLQTSHSRSSPAGSRAHRRGRSLLSHYDLERESLDPRSRSASPSTAAESLLRPEPLFRKPRSPYRHGNTSVLSVYQVTGGKEDFALQEVDPNFTDSDGMYYDLFAKNLRSLDGKTSEGLLSIEDYLVKCEKLWFDKYRAHRLGGSRGPSPARMSRLRYSHSRNSSLASSHTADDEEVSDDDQYLLGGNFEPPKRLKKFMQYRIGDWPVYSLLLALGQILAANSYQITLLTGEIGQTTNLFYIIATIYIITSVMWYILYRRLKSIYVLSIPFFFYGLAFFLVGMTPLVTNVSARGWVQNLATGMYAAASSSGSIFFALNFGDEGGSPIKSWVYRACLIQGTQQIYAVGLWYWGSRLTKLTTASATQKTPVQVSWALTAITIPAAAFLWLLCLTNFRYLPDFYRREPGSVPSFYKSVFRRKIILWFFVAIVIQNYWLSAPYGRNWEYLWSSKHAPTWAIFLLVILFFIGVWIAFIYLFSILSKEHSWILPIFAIGLGAPRWCQMLWGTSNIGLYVPWAGTPVASALVGRSLWLWLGVLDALQGVGFGMILLQTLTRLHISFTLIAAQIMGTIAAILAKASAPNKLGPGDVFPDFSAGAATGLMKPVFWVALIFQLLICAGFFMFFRKEQLSKP